MQHYVSGMVADSCSRVSDSCGISDLSKVPVNTGGSLRWALQQAAVLLDIIRLFDKSLGQVEEQPHIKLSSPRVQVFSVLSSLLQIFWGWGAGKGRKRFQVSLSAGPKGDRSMGFYQTKFS